MASGEYDDLLLEVAFDRDGLIPVVAQQHDTGEVLMVAWMNADSLSETLSTGRVCYWSRSRQALWRKGETSGQIQRLVELRLDCDSDTILARVDQTGVACHTGRRNCFYRSATADGWTVMAAPEVTEAELYGSPPPPGLGSGLGPGLDVGPGDQDAPISVAEPTPDEDDRNRRRFSRHDLDRTIEIYHRGYVIELPAKDISLTGVGLIACGVTHLKVGETCMVMLDHDTELEAEVVATRNDTLHLRFSADALEEVRYFLRDTLEGPQ
jgi:phosphoribosyl-AMP cyclohydrolase